MTPDSAVGLTAAWRPLATLALSAGVGTALYGAGGGMPDPGEMGDAFGRFVAAELALDVSDASTRSAVLGVLWEGLPGGSLWLRGGWESLEPAEDAVRLPWRPSGQRTTWSMRLGVVVDE